MAAAGTEVRGVRGDGGIKLRIGLANECAGFHEVFEVLLDVLVIDGERVLKLV